MTDDRQDVAIRGTSRQKSRTSKLPEWWSKEAPDLQRSEPVPEDLGAKKTQAAVQTFKTDRCSEFRDRHPRLDLENRP
jgi:hypothetical protein